MDDIVIVTEHLYLTEDKTRVVKEGDPASRWLWASPGQEVTRADAQRLGVIAPPAVPLPKDADDMAEDADAVTVADPDDAEPAGEAQKTAQPKARKPSANKARAKGEDK